MASDKPEKTLQEKQAECRERQETLVKLVREGAVRLRYNPDTLEYKGVFDVQQMAIFGLYLLGAGRKEIAEETGVSIARVRKLTDIYRKRFFGDRAVQAVIRGARARLLELIDPAVESVKYHVMNFNSPKNFDAATKIITGLGIFAPESEGDRTVNIAIIEKERKDNLSQSLETFGYKVVRDADNGGKPDAKDSRLDAV